MSQLFASGAQSVGASPSVPAKKTIFLSPPVVSLAPESQSGWVSLASTCTIVNSTAGLSFCQRENVENSKL